MASYRSNSFFLFVAITLLATVKVHAMIGPVALSVCGQTTEPVWCQFCMESHLDSPQDTANDIAGLAILCATRQSTRSLELLGPLINYTSPGPLQDAYKFIAGKVNLIRFDLNVVHDCWASANFQLASTTLATAIKDHFDCVQKLGEVHAYEPLFLDTLGSLIELSRDLIGTLTS